MKKGFTLIELLVVVLIIGILAAVALPQYEKTVEKSRSAEAFTILRKIDENSRLFMLANSSMGAIPSWDEDVLYAGINFPRSSDGNLEGKYFCFQSSGYMSSAGRGPCDGPFKYMISLPLPGLEGYKQELLCRPLAGDANICRQIGFPNKVVDGDEEYYMM